MISKNEATGIPAASFLMNQLKVNHLAKYILSSLLPL